MGYTVVQHMNPLIVQQTVGHDQGTGLVVEGIAVWFYCQDEEDGGQGRPRMQSLTVTEWWYSF